ncbi:hypothetical protein Csa_000266 [Cucumis sativus]|uniref:Uncharacterized protein n=1 Tax=Cucumis sativus TaxID=3659 RepID=A0A0A0KKG3_CUCSA|nr:hypothetical protein Csa_000266 [Cucumis sativus]
MGESEECFAEKCGAPLYEIRTGLKGSRLFRIWRQVRPLAASSTVKKGWRKIICSGISNNLIFI